MTHQPGRWITAIACIVMSQHAFAQKVEVEEFTLANGMQFLLIPRADQPHVVSAGWVAKVGSVNERPGITGISHFFEHMMFKGTDTIGTRDPNRDAKYREDQKVIRDQINQIVWTTQYERLNRGEIDDPWNPANDTQQLRLLRGKLETLMRSQQGRIHSDAIAKGKRDCASIDLSTEEGKAKAADLEKSIEQLSQEQSELSTIVKDEFDQVYTKAGGSGMNAFTSHDLTCYFITIPSNKLELWAWMESDRLNDSVFREFYSERDVVHEERRLRTDSTPTGRFQEQFDAMFWASCGYSWPVIGWPSDLNSYTFDQAQEYWNTYYRPGNLVGIVVGDFDPAKARGAIERYFSRLDPGTKKPAPVVTLEVSQLAEQRMNAAGDFPPAIEIRYHTVPAGHADSYPLDMLSEILNDRTGRLYLEMVEGRGIASSVATASDTRKYAGLFAFEAQTRGDSTPQTLEQAWYDVLEKLQKEPIGERELRKVKNRVAAGNYRRLQSNMSLLIQLAFVDTLLDWREINDGPKKYEAVTAEQIQQVAQKYFGSTGLLSRCSIGATAGSIVGQQSTRNYAFSRRRFIA
ncbi:MAG: insulinase family protein [Planctomycetaceae bacterium]|nr:MAG: insulinase family protein [Planctomycetaceae bacterium]